MPKGPIIPKEDSIAKTTTLGCALTLIKHILFLASEQGFISWRTAQSVTGLPWL